MTFASDAYAEGICNTAAGSEIEVFVDTIDDTLIQLNGIEAQDADDQDVLDTLVGRWTELREQIVTIESDNDEATVFAEED